MHPSTQNTLALKLRSLCQPSDPVILTNVWDAATARIVAESPSTKALATASYAIAATAGLEDPELTLEANIAGIRKVWSGIPADKRELLPLTADLQDGYSDVADSVRQVISAGAVGCNLEDLDGTTDELRSVEEHVSRIEEALRAARSARVPDFCINARTDVLGHGGTIDDAITRGRAYLAAGATTVYVWGGSGGRRVTRSEVEKLVEGLGGMVNMKMNLRAGFLNAKELAEVGVARISVGPELWHLAMKAVREAMDSVGLK